MIARTRWKFWLYGFLTALAVSTVGSARAQSVVNIHVRETAGIRRNAFPINARIPFPKGSLSDAAHVRLLLNDAEVPGQYAVESTWPDGSVRWLALDFNATVAPGEEATFKVEYGDSVKSAAVARGLVLTETPDAVQVNNIRFSKTGPPFLTSVKYRQEDIGRGLNGFTITDADGASHDLTGIEPATLEIVKRGPLSVVLRYSGHVLSSRVPFTITFEMPNSKAWLKASASVDDPDKRVREIAFHTPLALGAFPWSWDYGTGSWTYGTLRSKTDSVILTQVVKAQSGSEWQVRAGTKGQEQLSEKSAGRRPNVAEGWGHLQDDKEVVAFAVEGFGRQAGTYSISFDGEGQTSFRMAPAQPQARHSITVYEHFVASPVAIGAVTSPASILNPLVVFCDRDQYVKSGVPPPAEAGGRSGKR